MCKVSVNNQKDDKNTENPDHLLISFSIKQVQNCSCYSEKAPQLFLDDFSSFCRADEEHPPVRNPLILLPDLDCVGGALGVLALCPGCRLAGRAVLGFSRYCFKYVSCEDACYDRGAPLFSERFLTLGG